MAKVIKKKETSKNLMIFYSFPFNFLWKSLMTLMTMTLMTGFPWAIQGRHQFRQYRRLIQSLGLRCQSDRCLNRLG